MDPPQNPAEPRITLKYASTEALKTQLRSEFPCRASGRLCHWDTSVFAVRHSSLVQKSEGLRNGWCVAMICTNLQSSHQIMHEIGGAIGSSVMYDIFRCCWDIVCEDSFAQARFKIYLQER